MNTLNVEACPCGCLVPDLAAIEQGHRRFIGRSAKAPFEATGPVVIPARAEYRKAVRDGDLIPYDKATALLCGVSYEDL